MRHCEEGYIFLTFEDQSGSLINIFKGLVVSLHQERPESTGYLLNEFKVLKAVGLDIGDHDSVFIVVLVQSFLGDVFVG
jgi:hypothetical protein